MPVRRICQPPGDVRIGTHIMTEAPLPTPTFDHAVINARDHMDEAVAYYRRLGFQLTPRGRHTLGSINHLAIFYTTAQLYRSMFGGEAVRPVAGGFSLAMGLSRLDILTPAVVADSFGAATPDAAGCSTYPAALGLRVRRLDDTYRMLEGSGVGVRRDGARLVVPASEAFGATLEFVE